MEISNITMKSLNNSIKIIFLLLAVSIFQIQCKEKVTSIYTDQSSHVWIEYPDNREETRLVAEGAKMKIKGQTAYTVRVQIVVDNRVIADVPSYSMNKKGAFETIISEFGPAGTKEIIVRGIGNTIVDVPVTIENNPAKMHQRALQYLNVQYIDMGGRIRRFLNLSNGPYSFPIKIKIPSNAHVFRKEIEDGAKFWEIWADIHYKIILVNESFPDSPLDCYLPGPIGFLYIYPKFNEGGLPGACPHGLGYEFDAGTINLTKGWYPAVPPVKADTIAHEIGHILGLTHYDQNANMMDGGDYTLMHPYQIYALKWIYSHNPGYPL